MSTHNKSKHKRLSSLLLLALSTVTMLAILPAFASADAELKGTQPAQWRLMWTSNPQHEATVSWTTVSPGDKHRVYFATADKSQQGAVATHRDGKYTGGTTYYHHVRLTGLTPATRYGLVIESDGQRSPAMYFKTAPAKDQPLKIIFGGDSRSGREARRSINSMIASLVGKDPQIVAFAHGGDYVATGLSFDQWSAWMSDHELTVADDGRLTPIIPARGNHDIGELFNDIFDFPSRDANYYAVDIGPSIRFLTLNSNISAGGEQAKWLEQQLSTARPKYRWLLAQYHRPVFPAVKTPGPGLQYWVPLFEKYNLDMACEADGHTIKRTPAIRNNRPDPTGVVYIGEGGLGVGQRTPKFDDPARWYLKQPGKVGSGHHIQLLSFEGETLEYSAILLGGKVFDQATISARH